jgi:hypothetical protein
MYSRRIAIALSAVLLAGLASSTATAGPPRPGTEGNGLDENESATLWSRDVDSQAISDPAYREAYGESRTPLQAVANQTDLTFKRPPATASTWTRHDHRDYDPGDRTTSVYPQDATLNDSRFVRDVRASVFAVTPSTKAHRTPEETTWYIAPEGQVLGAVDYRVRTPSGVDRADRTVSWSVDSHEITEVRLLQNGSAVTRVDGSHRPNLTYELRAREGAMTLEADIEATLEKTTREAYYVTVTGPNGTNRTEKRWRTSTTTVDDSITVSETLDVEVYDLSVTRYRTTYPDGSSGIAVFQNRPWQGYTLAGNGSATVRGVWRFYTARDTAWDSLTRATSEGHRRVESDALPVYVHAYPSELGPRSEPAGTGPEITTVWGERRTSPNSTIGEHVNVEIVSSPYETSYGIAVRYSGFNADAFAVRGIVRGVTATIRTPAADHTRHVRESELSLEVTSQNESGATLVVKLEDRETGEPIVLDQTDDPRYAPLLDGGRSGYVTVAGQRLETNASGMATVRVDDSGLYTARYHPGSWLSHDLAYKSDTASARWHPLATVAGWVSLVTDLILWFLPFGLAWYAGRQIGLLFSWEVP